MVKAKILIVEDQKMISTNIRMLLKMNDYTYTDIAVTGKEALASIEKNKPDLILMDIALPGETDGIELANIVNERWNIPIIYLTLKKDIKTLERAKKTLPYGYITKSISLTDQLPIQIDFALYKFNSEKKLIAMQQKINESEKIFHGMANTAKDAIILLDSNGKATFANESASQMFGFTNEEILNNQLVDLIAPKVFYDDYKNGFSDFYDNGIGKFIGQTTELDVLSKDGLAFNVEVSMSTIVLDKKWFAICIFRDISLRKKDEEYKNNLLEELRITNQIIESNANKVNQLNETLREKSEELKESNASKDRFFSIIARDLKNPLQIIYGYAQLLINDTDKLPKKDIKNYISDISDSSEELIKLFENLLEWSKLQRNDFTNYPDFVNINDIICKTQVFLNQKIQLKKIKIKNKVNKKIEAYIDPSFLFTIIRNLLSNAIKYSNINSEVIIKSKLIDDDYVEISFQDFGVGIDESTQLQLFDINFRHSTYGTINEKGNGLGLILCKELLSISNGTISVKSLITKYSTFYITLPLKKNEDIINKNEDIINK